MHIFRRGQMLVNSSEPFMRRPQSKGDDGVRQSGRNDDIFYFSVQEGI